MFAVIRPDEALGWLGLVSVIYLVFVLLVFRRARLLESKLLILGLATSLMAIWVGPLAMQAGASVEVGPGTGRVFLGGDSAGIFGRIGFLLVLAGLAVSIMNSRNDQPASRVQEEVIRG